MTRDTWRRVNILGQCQQSSSYGLGFMIFEDLEERDAQLSQLINSSVNDKANCRTALAAPGLLNMKAIMVHI